MIEFPAAPEDPACVDADESRPAPTSDITQDGRLRLEGVWTPTGRLLWNQTNPRTERLRAIRERGIRTVLTHVVLEATDARLVPRLALNSCMRSRFEHTVDPQGAVSGVQFNTWLSTCTAETVNPGVSRSLVARAYGQRELVRLDAPRGRRRLTALDIEGAAWVPPQRTQNRQPAALLALPETAVPLDATPRLSSSRVVFGLCHTDWNQHVNFMNYPRFVEQFALERFVELGLGAVLLARSAAIGYRRACFAGERLRLALQAFALADTFGVLAAFVDDDGGPAERSTWPEFGEARCCARVLFAR